MLIVAPYCSAALLSQADKGLYLSCLEEIRTLIAYLFPVRIEVLLKFYRFLSHFPSAKISINERLKLSILMPIKPN